jgi:hypothetical protein
VKLPSLIGHAGQLADLLSVTVAVQPRVKLLFAGSPGVGKSELSRRDDCEIAGLLESQEEIPANIAKQIAALAGGNVRAAILDAEAWKNEHVIAARAANQFGVPRNMNVDTARKLTGSASRLALAVSGIGQIRAEDVRTLAEATVAQLQTAAETMEAENNRQMTERPGGKCTIAVICEGELLSEVKQVADHLAQAP